MNTQPANTNSEQTGMTAQQMSTQQARMSAQQSSTSAQQPRIGVQQVNMSTQHPIMSTLQSGMNIQQPRMSVQQASVSTQHPSMSTQQSNMGGLQTNMSTQYPNIGTHYPNISAQYPNMNIQHPSMSAQQAGMSLHHLGMSAQPPNMSAQQPNMSAQQPSMSTQQAGMGIQQPSLSSQMNLTSQQINMLNQMNLHGHPITLMSAQPVAMNINNQPMNLHGHQLGMGMNPQLLNINIHPQPIPINMNTHHMINMHAPHLNMHAPQLNLIHQPLNINTQHLNIHPQHMGMTAHQYNMHQMRLHQQIAAQQMHAQQIYMNPHHMHANSPQVNIHAQPGIANAQQTSSQEVPNAQPPPEPVDRAKICQWLLELNEPSTRENALIELGKRRDDVPDLAVLIWHGFGTAAALLQEIMSIYPAINPAILTASQSNRVCNALALLQCVAANPETRPLFLAAQFPLFLYPFLHTVSKNRPFEYLRLTCLGVIGALVKSDEAAVIQYLLDTEIIPLCLRIMESSTELNKIVATFILQKILASETGLNYVCETYERFSHIAMILGKLILTLATSPAPRLLKHIIKCYLRLSEHPRAREALRQCLPDQLADTTFYECLRDEPTTRSWIGELLVNLEIPRPYYDPRQLSKSSTSTTPH